MSAVAPEEETRDAVADATVIVSVAKAEVLSKEQPLPRTICWWQRIATPGRQRH
ncbi:MAG: hypothetical protein ACYYK0_02050 [Candidatus Eutrophobiaceae bacterium]